MVMIVVDEDGGGLVPVIKVSAAARECLAQTDQ